MSRNREEDVGWVLQCAHLDVKGGEGGVATQALLELHLHRAVHLAQHTIAGMRVMYRSAMQLV